MNLMEKALFYVMTVIATIAGLLWLQVEGIFPLPGTPGWWNIHPLYSFPTWTYIAVFSLFVTLAVVFMIIDRKKSF